MATWTLNSKLTDSTTLTVNSTDHLWLAGTDFSTYIVVGQFNDSTHVSDANDVERCTSVHPHNLKYLSSTTASLDGGASTTVSGIANTNAPFIFNFSDASSVATSSASFYAYDGTTDANPMSGIEFYAAEVGTSTSWVAANGSANALSLANQAAATSHDFYIGFSASPTATGAKTGSVKCVLTYA